MAVLHFLYKIEVFDCYLFAKSDRVKAGLHDRFFLGPVHTGTISFRSVLLRSEKRNAQGLCSHGNASNDIVPFQKVER